MTSEEIDTGPTTARPPGVLILKGGGVKGLALAGAIRELEPFVDFGTFVGTSAGAITAILLAAGYDAKQLEDELWKKDFASLLSSPVRGLVLLPFRKGIYDGVAIQDWISELLRRQLDTAGDPTLEGLAERTGFRAVVYAAHSDGKLIAFDSHGERKATEAHYAARCSMSIPLFFRPATVDSKYVFDGGTLGNFPVDEFLQSVDDEARDGLDWIGLYLGSGKTRPIRNRGLVSSILGVFLGQDEARIIDENPDRVIRIDPTPVGTVDFGIERNEKELLVLRGRLAAVGHLIDQRLRYRISDDQFEVLLQLERKLKGDADEACRRAIVDRQRRKRRWVAKVGSVLLAIALVWLWGPWRSGPPAPMEGVTFPAHSEFTMGSPVGEVGRDADELQHEVRFTYSFWISTTEITQAQWSEVFPDNPSFFKNAGPDSPVDSVNWFDAVAWCNRRSELEGLEPCYTLRGESGTPGKPGYKAQYVEFRGLQATGYRLPTEAEWEFAARGGSKQALYTGDLTILGKNHAPELNPIAHYGGNSKVDYEGAVDCSEWPDMQFPARWCGTHPVKGKRPNQFGLFDVLGNVCEWVGDYYDEYPAQLVVNPVVSPKNADYRVVRGGSYAWDAVYLRLANRSQERPSTNNRNFGFRVARTVSGP